ncbi:hypothetical protein CPB85DRAFT_1303102 [Mucidula mucida]|nr:hypothetical protein CPB85DRAFT_1303102 [Mucidula mucida]
MIPGILPILDMLPFGGHWLAVMPRWGDTVGSPWFESMQEILTLIRCLIEGLSHVHSFKIVHRDVDTYNMLVNHVQLTEETSKYCIRQRMRREERMKYALFDFDFSLLLPPETHIESCRRPYKESVVGHDTPIPDVWQGEYEYNPFAYDVGCLGEFLCFRFQHLTPLVPMLAPLFDSMIHWNVESRLTAAQALQFFDDLYPQLDQEQLQSYPPKYDLRTSRPYEEHDRWARLPEDFVKQWSHMRMPKVPITIKLLRLICRPRFGAALVRTLRRMIDKLTWRLL